MVVEMWDVLREIASRIYDVVYGEDRGEKYNWYVPLKIDMPKAPHLRNNI